MTARRRRTGPGTLVILSLFLASSGALRLGAEAGEAMSGPSDDVAAHDGPETLAAPADCPAPPVALAAALAAREAEIEHRALAVEERMAALDLAEKAIATRLAELEDSEVRLRATLALADGATEDDLTRLTAVYEAMKPKEAAAIFEAMEPDFAAGFLGRMRPEASAAILGGMKPETAYTISALIAGRNAAAPTE